jgi:hypothetical protein
MASFIASKAKEIYVGTIARAAARQMASLATFVALSFVLSFALWAIPCQMAGFPASEASIPKKSFVAITFAPPSACHPAG